MTFDEYWNVLLERNPSMKDAGRMTITVESFRKSLRQAFEKGAEQQKRGEELFDQLFGKMGARS